MYQQKPVIPQYLKEKRKSYLRRLLGRLNRLKKMVKRREDEVLPFYQSKIDEIDKQIIKLQKKKDRWDSKKIETFTELKNIRSEMVNYISEIEQIVKIDTTSHIKPIFLVREVPKYRNGKEYVYFEGRVRGRTVKGRRSKDKDYHIGTKKDLPKIIYKELGIEVDNDIKYSKLVEHLKKIIEKWWLEDLGSSSF